MTTINEPELILRAMVQPMCDWLGREGLAYFQGVSDASRGSLTAANVSFNGNHGMRVRNKMRELLGITSGEVQESDLPEHFLDDNWELLVKMCMSHTIKKNCKVCDGTGLVRPLVMGELDVPVEPCPVCRRIA